eukprot:3820483-Amphidinium_carterae.1
MQFKNNLFRQSNCNWNGKRFPKNPKMYPMKSARIVFVDRSLGSGFKVKTQFLQGFEPWPIQGATHSCQW